MDKSTLRHHSVSIGVSKYVVATLASFVVGIYFGDLIHLDLWWLVGIVVGLLIALITMWRGIQASWRMGFFILIGLTIGLSYFNFWDGRQKSIHLIFNKESEIEGQVVGHPDFSGSQANYVLKMPVSLDHEMVKIRLTASRYPEYHYGDVLKFKTIICAPIVSENICLGY